MHVAAGGGVVDASAAAMASIWAEVRRDANTPMPPRLALIALWIALADAPFFEVPWQPLQYCV